MSEEKKTIPQYVSLGREPEKVHIQDLTFICTMHLDKEKEYKYCLIEYLQDQAKRILRNEPEDSKFWYNLNSILQSWYQYNVHMAIDSKGKVYGYLVGNNTLTFLPTTIHIMEVIYPYRGKGVGTFMVEQFEKSCINNARKSINPWNGYIHVDPLPTCVDFWRKIGYLPDKNYIYTKKIAQPIIMPDSLEED